MFAYIWMVFLSHFQVNIKTIHDCHANFRAAQVFFFFFATEQYYFIKNLLLLVKDLGF